MYQKHQPMDAMADQKTSPSKLGSTIAQLLANSCDSNGNVQPSVANVSGDNSLSFYEMFFGSGQINKNNVNKLLRLAEKHQAKDCIIECIQYLKDMLNIESVCFVLDMAFSNSWMILAAVHGPCINIVYENFSEVIKSSGFAHCYKNTLRTILSQRPSNRNEYKVVEAVVKWAQNVCTKDGIDSTNPQNLRQVINANFCLIYFETMTELDFYTCQMEYRLLTSREETEILN